MHVFVRARAAAIVLSAVAVGIVLEHASAATARSDGAVIARAVAAPSPTPGDTNVVYGPRNFTSPTGAQTVNVERFVVTLDSGAKYSLRVVNGDPGGANRATSGSVKLNQTTVIASTDLASGPQTIVRDVVPRSVDTITVTIGGTAGSHVVASLFATARPTVTLFGAKTYIRPNGNASSPSDNFSGIAGVGAPFTLIARNGDSTGGHRASSASVSLNGTTVIAASKDIGTSLTILPTINADGYVDLQLAQEVSTATTEVQFGAPVISTRETSTHLLVRNGQTAMLGGLVDRTQEASHSGVPFLAAIPLAGHLFGSALASRATTELFLFLTPYILETDSDVDKLREEVERQSKWLRDAKTQTIQPPAKPPFS